MTLDKKVRYYKELRERAESLSKAIDALDKLLELLAIDPNSEAGQRMQAINRADLDLQKTINSYQY